MFRPQPGPQEQFLETDADIAIYGGSAGSGKSFALLLDPVRHADNPKFGGIIFRRTSPQLTGAGSLWDEAQAIYRALGAELHKSRGLEVVFPKGGLLQLGHLQYTHTVHDHHGKQYAAIYFDELTHFESYQFWYMVSRLRSVSGIRPYMRCTCNPDPDSFVRKLIDWWIGPDGLPMRDRSGILRWFVRVDGSLEWGDSKEDLRQRFGSGCLPMSLTFIPAKLDDNPELLRKNPGYRAYLESMHEVDRQRLLEGNWDARPTGGDYIKRDYFETRWHRDDPLILALSDWMDNDSNECPFNVYGASDYAVTEYDSTVRDPDYTEHGVFGVDRDDNIWVLDWWYGQTASDKWIEAQLDLWKKWRPIIWFGEEGVIRKAVEPFLHKRSRERRIYCRTEWLSPLQGLRDRDLKAGYRDRSKRAKSIRGRSFQARAAMGKVIFPEHAQWAERVIDQNVSFPEGFDDAFDVMSLFCRGIDQTYAAKALKSDVNMEDRYDRLFQDAWGTGDSGWRTV